MRYYESFDSININKSLLGEQIFAFNKYDGQNFVAKFNVKKKVFDSFGSRKRLVDETDEQFGKAVVLFKEKIEDKLIKLVALNKGKKGIFEGVKEIEFYFEYVGENSFCGMHDENDEMHLVLIDIWIYKKGYIEPQDFCKLTNGLDIDVAEVIYQGPLNYDFIKSIEDNNWNIENCLYPNVKEGVVCKRTTKKKGQYLPKVKVKTNWWLEKVKERYPKDWEDLI